MKLVKNISHTKMSRKMAKNITPFHFHSLKVLKFIIKIPFESFLKASLADYQFLTSIFNCLTEIVKITTFLVKLNL